MQIFKATKKEMISAAILLMAVFAIGTTSHARGTRSNTSVSVNPTAVNFGKINVGATTKPVAVSLHNNGRTTVTISSVSLSLLQVSYSGPALPVTLSAGQTLQAAVSFSPNAAKNYAGTLSFAESTGHTVAEELSGTGVAVTTPTPPPPPTPSPAVLNLSSSTLSFGGLTVGTSASQTVTVSNSGGSNLTISGVSISGAGFSSSGVSSGLILASGQSSTLDVTFDPSATGNMTGSVAITSNVSSGAVALSGSGIAAPVSNSVSLSWNLDGSATNGCNIYSGSTSGGPYTKVNSTSVMPTSYNDNSVQAGQTYYFVVTAINASNVESDYSNEVSALIP